MRSIGQLRHFCQSNPMHYVKCKSEITLTTTRTPTHTDGERERRTQRDSVSVCCLKSFNSQYAFARTHTFSYIFTCSIFRILFSPLLVSASSIAFACIVDTCTYVRTNLCQIIHFKSEIIVVRSNSQ